MSDEKPIEASLVQFKVGAPSPETAARLARALDSLHASWPSSNAGATAVPDVSPGQFWRALDDQQTPTAVLVLAVPAPGTVRVAPTTFDPDLATDHARVLEPEVAGLGCPVVVWELFEHLVSVAVLDTWLGQLPPEDTGVTGGVVSGLAKSGKAGRPVHTPTDIRAELEADLADEMDALANTQPWQPVAGDDLHEMLSELKASQIAEVLQVPKPDALGLKRGARPLTEQEAERLSPLVGRPVEELAAAGPPLPTPVVDLFNTPRVRAEVRELAHRSRRDEETMRRRAAYEVTYASAARTTNRMDDTADIEMWVQRVRQYFEVKLGSAEDQ